MAVIRSVVAASLGALLAACLGGKLAGSTQGSTMGNGVQEQQGATGDAAVIARDCGARLFGPIDFPTYGADMAVQEDGSLLLAGTPWSGYRSVPNGPVLVLRLRKDGTIDPSFGVGGVVAGAPIVPRGDYSGWYSGLVGIQMDQTLSPLVTFLWGDSSSTYAGAFHPDAYDGGTAQALLSPMLVQDQYRGDPQTSLLRRRVGFSVVYWAPQVTVLRFNDDLTTDASFGPGGLGKVVLPTTAPNAGFSGLAQAEDSQGRLLVAADDFTHITLRRLLTDGSVDTTFGVDGTFTYDDSVFTTPNVFRLTLAVDAMDRPLLNLQGRWQDSDGLTTHSAIVRLDSAGRVDASFGSGGAARLDQMPGLGRAIANQLWPRADGTLLMYGWLGSYLDGGIPIIPSFFARLEPSGALDVTFGGAGLCALDFTGGAAVRGNTLVVVEPLPPATTDVDSGVNPPPRLHGARIELP